MSVTETKMVKISEIVLDVKIYPRENKEGNKYVILKYAEEMRVGDVFPPILLGLFEGKYYLVDGWHRIKANEKIGKVRVLATTKQYSNKREIYKDAVKKTAVANCRSPSTNAPKHSKHSITIGTNQTIPFQTSYTHAPKYSTPFTTQESSL